MNKPEHQPQAVKEPKEEGYYWAKIIVPVKMVGDASYNIAEGASEITDIVWLEPGVGYATSVAIKQELAYFDDEDEDYMNVLFDPPLIVEISDRLVCPFLP